jgi:cob(I)alamin adenosyltransferase
MRKDLAKKIIGVAVAIMLVGLPSLGLAAQDKPADNMQILRDKIKADKKLVVAENMELTESEAKNFWPIYDDYQKELQKINRRLIKLLESYADDMHKKSLTDDKAKKLIDEANAIEQAEVNIKSTFAPKLSKALPTIKVARYLQIENKIRAIVRYELAQGVPLMK